MVFRRHGVRRLPAGGLRITMSTTEHAALAALPRELEPIVTGEADDGAATRLRARLYPDAYDEPQLEDEYRDLVGEELVQGRVDALETFADSLERGQTAGSTWTVDLDPDQAQAWLAVVNDSRLLLAGIVGITSEEQWEAGPDPGEPASMLLWYLGWLEEELVGAMMGSLPEN